MTVNISPLPFKALWNSEYTLFVNQTVGIIEKYHPENLHLTKSFGKIKAMLPSLAKIKAQELSNAISNKLQELDTKRNTLIITIAAQVKSLWKLSLPKMAPHVVVLNHFFDTHVRDNTLANYNAETERLSDLLADYDENPDVIIAAEALNLKMLFEQLRDVNKQFAGLFKQRTGVYADIQKANAIATRHNTGIDVSDETPVVLIPWSGRVYNQLRLTFFEYFRNDFSDFQVY